MVTLHLAAAAARADSLILHTQDIYLTRVWLCQTQWLCMHQERRSSQIAQKKMTLETRFILCCVFVCSTKRCRLFCDDVLEQSCRLKGPIKVVQFLMDFQLRVSCQGLQYLSRFFILHACLHGVVSRQVDKHSAGVYIAIRLSQSA